MDGRGLLGLFRPTHDMTRPHCRADRAQADAKAEQLHVLYKPVVVRVVDPAINGKAAANKRHIRVEALHCLVQTVLVAVPNHVIRVAQLLLIGLQKLTNDGNYSRFDPHLAGGQGLEKLG